MNDSLLPVLEKATDEELDPLVGYISKKFSDELTTSEEYKKFFPKHSRYYRLIGEEIRKFGGSTLVNLVRGEGPGYKEIVVDVAKKLKVNFQDSNSIENIEREIIAKVISDSYEKMNDEQKRDILDLLGEKNKSSILASLSPAIIMSAMSASGFLVYQLSVIVANAVARTLLGSGLSFAINAGITRTLGVFLGPVGWVLTGIWTVKAISDPAYSVTIPCVIHVAMLRAKQNSKVDKISFFRNRIMGLFRKRSG